MRDIPDPAPTFQGSEAEKLTDIEFGIEDVKRVLSKLRADKASGVDELLPRFLSEIQEALAYPLYVMWRKSLNEGVVPDDWKRANVTPIYKKGGGAGHQQRTTARSALLAKSVSCSKH